jgi:hypothetical protein
MVGTMGALTAAGAKATVQGRFFRFCSFRDCGTGFDGIEVLEGMGHEV